MFLATVIAIAVMVSGTIAVFALLSGNGFSIFCNSMQHRALVIVSVIGALVCTGIYVEMHEPADFEELVSAVVVILLVVGVLLLA